jgi:hypothetical protein
MPTPRRVPLGTHDAVEHTHNMALRHGLNLGLDGQRAV